MKDQQPNKKITSLLIALGLLNDLAFLQSARQSKTLQVMLVLVVLSGAGFVLFLFKMAGA